MSRCFLLSRPIVAALLSFAIYSTPITTCAEEATDDGQLPVNVMFRRLFVPADAPETWPVGSERFLPIPRKEFSRLIRQQNQSLAGTQPQPPAHLIRCVYRAKLLSNDVLQGTAEWSVELPGGRSQLLPLSPLNFAIETAFWRRDPTQQALLGLWESANLSDKSSTQSAVVVEQEDTLVMHWQLAARKVDAAQADFFLQKPIVVPQTLELDLPANYRASVSHAQLLSTDSAPHGEKRWVFQLAPREAHRLRIRRPIPVQVTQNLPLISQATFYQLEPAGLNVVTRLRLDAREASIAELKTVLDEGLRVVGVDIDQQPVAWQVVDGVVDGRSESTLLIPRPESQQPQSIEIRCMSKFRPTAEAAWKLPKLRFSEVAWTEGTTSLFVSPDLELRSLIPRQATLQHIVGIADSAREGEVFRLQEWSRDAEIEIKVGRLQKRIAVQVLTTVELGRDEIQARLVAELSSLRGNVYQVDATVAPGWTIDSISTTPKSTLSEWHLDDAADIARIFVQLNRPISEQRPLRLEIKARKLTQESVLPASVGQLKLLRFLNADIHRELLQLRARQSEHFVVSSQLERARLTLGEETREVLITAATNLAEMPIDRENSSYKSAPGRAGNVIPPLFRDLVSKAPVGILLDVSGLELPEIIELRQQPAQYNSNLHIEVEASRDSFKQSYQIDCHPISGTVSELVLEVDSPLPETMQWAFVERKGKVTMERLEPSSEEPSPSNPVRYSLRLPVALSQDFRVQASYSLPAKPLEKCNLLHLSRASEKGVSDWNGQVVLRGALDGFEILDLGWTPTVLSKPNYNQERLPVLGVYQLNAETMPRGVAAKGLRLRRQDSVVPAPSLVAWLAEFDTLQASSGAAIHTVCYSLENLATSEARIALPPGAELQEAWLDEQQLELEQLFSQSGEYLFQFDNKRRWPSIVLKYSTRDSFLKGSASIQPVMPKCSFPVKLKRWTLWAPEQYEIDNMQRRYSSQNIHWWKRVFGPLARSRGESVFNPFESTSWTELWSASMVGLKKKQIAEVLADQLISRLESRPNESLGVMLSDLSVENQYADFLCVDRKALLAMGVAADTTASKLVAHARVSSRSAWKRPLSSYRLAILASSKTILLTTSERVAHWRDQLRPTELSGVFLVSSDDLVESIENIRHSHSTDILEVARWQGSAGVEGSPWNHSGTTMLADVGRSAQTVEFTEQLPTLVVRRAHVQRALWYAIVLFTLVFGVWQFDNYRNLMIFTAAVACAACLTVPAQWLTIPQSVFLGLVATAVVRAVLKTPCIWDSRADATGKLAREIATILLICISLQDRVLAQAPTTAVPNLESLTPVTEQKSANLPRVLIPINSQGQRQGEDVYVPERFLEKINSPPRQREHGGAEYVIRSATYSGSLSGQSAIATPSSDISSPTNPWKLRWKVESFVPKCRLFLPLRRDEAFWYESSHRLDGLPVSVEWLPGGEGCTIELSGTGVHWLQLIMQPQVQIEERSALVHLHIPPLSGTKLDFVVASNVDGLRVTNAGRIAENETQSRWHGLLGTTDTLELRWNLKSIGSNNSSWDSLEQLSWLHVDPATARLEVQLSVTGYLSDSRLLELNVAPQLRLEPIGEDSLIAEVIMSSPDQPTRLQLKLRSGLPTDFVIPLRFELQRSASVGHLFFPKVRVLGLSPVQKLFAISVSAGLSYAEQVSSDLRSIEPAEFSKHWGTSAGQPLFAYTMEQKDPEWSLRVRPDPHSYTTQQTLRVHCLPHEARIDFEAVIDQPTGSWLSHRIQVPETLQVDTITVHNHLRENVAPNSIPVRWSRASATEVIVFLGHPLNRAHRVKLAGRIAATKENEIELPQVQLLHDEQSKIHMDLFRTEGVRVSWATPLHAPEEMPGQRITHDREVLFVGRYSWRSSQVGELSRIRLGRNEQALHASSVTTVELGHAGWTAQVNSHLRVRKGIVSRLRLTAPKSFQMPYLLQPEQIGVIDEVLETSEGKEITVLLSRPVAAGDEIEFRLQGSLSLPADKRLTIPSIYWNEATQQDRYVLLPKHSEKHPLQWQTTGLRRQALPPRLNAFASGDDTARSFRVEQSPFEARESTHRGTLQNAMIRYAKVSGILNSEGWLTATAEFIFQPGRATSCAVRLPPESRLYNLIVGDRPARRELREDGCWKVPVGPPFMPQRIVMSYQTKLGPMGRNLRLTAPKILLGDQSLPAPETWWRIRTAQGLQLGTPTEGQLTSRSLAKKSRFQFTQRVLEDALSQALELPNDERRAWAETWQSVSLQALQEWQTSSLMEKDSVDLVAAEKALKEFAVSFAFDDSTTASRSRSLTYLPRLPMNIEISPDRQEYFYVSDSSGQVAFVVSRGPLLNLWRWFAVAALVSGALAVLLQLRHSTRWQKNLCLWPHSRAIGGGLVWWLLLSPSAVGLLIIALAVASKTIKQTRHFRRKSQEKSSTQLALPTS